MLKNRYVTIQLTDNFFNQTYIEITNACTLECPYCFNSSKRANNIFMSKDDIYKYAQVIHYSTKKPLVYLSGGEPCLHPDFAEIVCCLASKSTYKIVILTNGTISDQKFLETLPRKVCWQIGNALVSSPELYANNMSKHLANIERILTNFPETIHTLAYTITAQNYMLAEQYIKTFLKYTNVKFLLSFVQKRGAACQNWSKLSLSASVKLSMIHQLSSISSRVQFCGISLDNDLSIIFEKEGEYGCHCQNNKELYVNSKGQIHFCEKIDALSECPSFVELKIDTKHQYSLQIPADCVSNKCNISSLCVSSCIDKIKGENRLCQV